MQDVRVVLAAPSEPGSEVTAIPALPSLSAYPGNQAVFDRAGPGLEAACSAEAGEFGAVAGTCVWTDGFCFPTPVFHAVEAALETAHFPQAAAMALLVRTYESVFEKTARLSFRSLDLPVLGGGLTDEGALIGLGTALVTSRARPAADPPFGVRIVLSPERTDLLFAVRSILGRIDAGTFTPYQTQKGDDYLADYTEKVKEALRRYRSAGIPARLG